MAKKKTKPQTAPASGDTKREASEKKPVQPSSLFSERRAFGEITTTQGMPVNRRYHNR